MPVERLTFPALGSTCHLFVRDGSPSLLAGGRAWIEQMHARLTRFDPDSELSRLNAARGEWCRVSSELEALLRACLRAFELSGGLVNAAVLQSMLAIGYTRTLAAGPTRASLEEALPAPPLPQVLEVERRRARVRDAGIDLGGVAKGWLADRLCERIGRQCLVNLGGDLRARGRWPVGLGGRTLLLEDMGAATSSTRSRRWGQHHHLVDPRSGLPARTDIGEISVVAGSGFEAEVFAKAALLLGGHQAPAFLAANCLAWSYS
jgi:thiamine biosynthesis lipoprotein